jgi:hypothetical protein
MSSDLINKAEEGAVKVVGMVVEEAKETVQDPIAALIATRAVGQS